MQRLVLGSTSPFRKGLLEKLGLPFVTCAPQVDESRLPGETPHELVARLAETKARDVAKQYPETLTIGSDQVACIDGIVVGKPGVRDKAIEQLSSASGKSVTFYTGLCLYNARADRTQTAVEPFVVNFRALTEAQIARYVDREKPFNCAGSFKSEGYGITLFTSLDGRDPNTLIGLPLIRLVEMLDKEGVILP